MTYHVESLPDEPDGPMAQQLLEQMENQIANFDWFGMAKDIVSLPVPKDDKFEYED